MPVTRTRLTVPALAVLCAMTLAGASPQPASKTAPSSLDALARQSLARIEGELRIQGLKQPVEIIRDRQGVPHIYAKNDDDLFFAQGYVMAQDRLWQLEMWRRWREGRLAEVFGPKAFDYDARVRVLESQGWTATATQAHNERGFAQKNASIASAVLYTLAPSGSLIMVPDSKWTHELWAGFLVGAALRGCRVYVIAPSAANAPAAGFPMMARTREIFSRFVEIGKILGDTIAARGGSIRTGLYTRRAGVNDVRAKLIEMHETFERYPFLKTDFPFPPEFYDGFTTGIARLEAMAGRPPL